VNTAPPTFGPFGDEEQQCRKCGCMADDACYRPDHSTCWWVEPDLCSHCARPWEPRPRHLLPKGILVAAGTWIALETVRASIDLAVALGLW
jgi:hypothetical protein